MINRSEKGRAVKVTNKVDRDDRLPMTVTIELDGAALREHLPTALADASYLERVALWRKQRNAFDSLRRTAQRMALEAINTALEGCVTVDYPEREAEAEPFAAHAAGAKVSMGASPYDIAPRRTLTIREI